MRRREPSREEVFTWVPSPPNELTFRDRTGEIACLGIGLFGEELGVGWTGAISDDFRGGLIELGIAALSFVENDEAEGEDLVLIESISEAGR